MQNLSLNQVMSLITEDLSLKGIFHFQTKQSSLSLDQLLLVNSTGIQFARDSVSQMLITAPLNLSQLNTLFMPLEQVNAYFKEKFIVGFSQQFDSSLVLMDKLAEMAKENEMGKETRDKIRQI